MEKNLCFEHLKLDDITAEFVYNVPTVGEESITDWFFCLSMIVTEYPIINNCWTKCLPTYPNPPIIMMFI